jgi:hypothetical protein
MNLIGKCILITGEAGSPNLPSANVNLRKAMMVVASIFTRGMGLRR